MLPIIIANKYPSIPIFKFSKNSTLQAMLTAELMIPEKTNLRICSSPFTNCNKIEDKAKVI